MRLTLRTLLAYLDGLLEPKDSEELGKKIEESEYASTLVHRIRDAMRRLRLGAPSVTDRGPGLDPNTVAEYLDNTLDSDGVPEFEKVCLDSDVHLAEVAACHQILTLVLGEPAEVDSASREQMYQLKDRSGHAPPLPPTIEQPTLSADAGGPMLDLGDLGLGGRKARPRPTVPEYLREPPRKPIWVSIAAAIVLVVCVTGIVLKSLGQFEPETPLGRLLVDLGVIAAPPAVADVTDGERRLTTKPQTEASTPETSKPAIEPKREAERPQVEAANKEPPAPSTQQPANPPVEVPSPPTESPKASKTVPPSLPLAPPTSAKEPAPTPEAVKQPTVVPPPETTKPPETPKRPPLSPEMSKQPETTQPPETAKQPPELVKQPESVKQPPEAAKTMPETKQPETAKEPEPDAKSSPKPPPIPGVDDQPEKQEAPPPKTPATPQREALGRLMSSDQLLLTRSGEGEWTRVTANQVLFPQEVLVLPTYRAKVALTAGVAIDILSGAKLELLVATGQQPPGLRIQYGRAVMRPLAKGDSKLRLAFGDRAGTLTFVDADSAAAIDVRRIHAPGANPETETPRIAAALYAVAGAVSWQESVKDKNIDPVQLTSSQRCTLDGNSKPVPTAVRELPRWITAEPIKDLDRRASSMLSQCMAAEKPEKPAQLSLLELATSRPQREVRWLALRSLGYLGHFTEMVAALDDPARKLDWQDYYVEELRAAVARDAKTAAAVHSALERRYSQQAADLYRMLCGYTQDDLQNGEDAKLVHGLDGDSLAVRRLSFWNLRDITGLGLFYQPEQPAARRRMAVQAWRQRLEGKEIRPRSTDERALPAERVRHRSTESAPPAPVAPRMPDAASP